MKSIFKKSAGTMMLAATAMGLGGAALATTAPSADALGVHKFIHGSAHYTSASQCNSYLNNNKAKIKSSPSGTVTWSGTCHKVSNYWTYDRIEYGAYVAQFAGDQQLPSGGIYV